MLLVPPAVAAAGRKWEELMRRSPRARVIGQEKVRRLVLGGGLVAACALFGTDDTRGVDRRNGRRKGTPLYVYEAAITKLISSFNHNSLHHDNIQTFLFPHLVSG